jgi:hypothetical protein
MASVQDALEIAMVIWGTAFHCDPQLLSANLGGSKPQGVLPHFKLPRDILSIVGPTHERGHGLRYVVVHGAEPFSGVANATQGRAAGKIRGLKPTATFGAPLRDGRPASV